MQGAFTVRGHRIRSQSQRRFIVVVVPTEGAAWIHKRSDSIATARAHVQRFGFHSSRVAVVIDTTTGEEVRGY